jgi:DNA-binding NarL/FixJ family response regulator
LRRKIDDNETCIRTLKSQLADFERTRSANIDEANASLPTPLTPREFQVLKMAAKGDTNKEISKTLDISAHTVKSHIIHIFNKLGVNDRTQASVWAASRGLL